MTSPEVEARWRSFRQQHFPDEAINLNPAAVGTVSAPVRQAVADFQRRLGAHPLGQYQGGREALQRSRVLAEQLWGTHYQLAVTAGTTVTMNLLLLAMAGRYRDHPVHVLSTTHEHKGGLSGFERHPAFTVQHADSAQRMDPEQLAALAFEQQPDLVLLSQRTWTRGERLPIKEHMAAVRERAPGCRIIVDAAQSLGVEPELVPHADAVVASAHKWLSGPLGLGFLWLAPDFAHWLQALTWMGHGLDERSASADFEPGGGQDFAALAGLEAALKLYGQHQHQAAGRSEALARAFAQGLEQRLGQRAIGHRCTVNGPTLIVDFEGFDPYPLYVQLNALQVHVKCIKATLRDGEVLNLLRLGFPYYECRDRLNLALERVEQALDA